MLLASAKQNTTLTFLMHQNTIDALDAFSMKQDQSSISCIGESGWTGTGGGGSDFEGSQCTGAWWARTGLQAHASLGGECI